MEGVHGVESDMIMNDSDCHTLTDLEGKTKS